MAASEPNPTLVLVGVKATAEGPSGETTSSEETHSRQDAPGRNASHPECSLAETPPSKATLPTCS